MPSPTRQAAPKARRTRDMRPAAGQAGTAGDGTGAVDRAGRQGGHVAEMQRWRLLTGVVEVVDERGVQALNVSLVCKRAGVSRRTFYDLFGDRNACLHAAFEDCAARATQAVERSASGHDRWSDTVRAGLTGLLSFLDDDPGAGRLLIVEALSCGGDTLEARRRVMTAVTAVVADGRSEAKRGGEVPPLTAELIVGAVFSAVHARMLEHDPNPLVELVGPLMAMIVQPYLGPSAAQRELHKSVEFASPPTATRPPADPFRGLPMRLTYRTARVLSSIAASPGSSSKDIAASSGITDDGQASRLLRRLQNYGLIEDTGVGPGRGMARAWWLTPRGEGVLQASGQS